MAQVTYREANRRYRRAYWPVIAVYAAACLGGAFVVKQSPPMWTVALIAVLTAAPIMAVFWLMRRLLNETDEYTRKIQTEALLTAGAITLSLTTLWSFLELYGLVQQDRYFPAMMFVTPAFLIFQGISLSLRRVREGEPACDAGA